LLVYSRPVFYIGREAEKLTKQKQKMAIIASVGDNTDTGTMHEQVDVGQDILSDAHCHSNVVNLPQPTPKQGLQSSVPSYEYHTTATLSQRFFNGDGGNSNGHGLNEGDLVWVSKSKGKKKKQTAVDIKSATNDKSANVDLMAKTVAKISINGEHCREGIIDIKKEEIEISKDDNTDEWTWRTELFLRARVVSVGSPNDGQGESKSNHPKEGRILVQYPKGSKYSVRPSNLTPILEPSRQQNTCDGRGRARAGIVLVVPETNEYRRLAVLHTCPGDSFLEIGCAFGDCTDRVRRSLEEGGDVPFLHSQTESDAKGNHKGIAMQANESESNDECDKNKNTSVSCIGVDKSADSVSLAKTRFPESAFFPIQDALNNPEELNEICSKYLLHGAPSVVAIDINGSRELPAVLQCIEVVMNSFGAAAAVADDDDDISEDCGPIVSSPNATSPRLILVKSRSLHSEMLRNES
jgi:hypothetical protein